VPKRRERTGWDLAEGNGCRDVRDERDKGKDGFHEGQLLQRSTFFVFPLKALGKQSGNLEAGRPVVSAIMIIDGTLMHPGSPRSRDTHNDGCGES
jgi:hypothetical protein